MFHHFHDGVHPVGQGSISGGQFADVIDFVGRDRILPADEWMRRALARRLEPGDLCVTFDDNLRCQYDVAYPVMKALGITAFWFAYTSVMQGNVEKLEIYRLFRSTRFASVDDFYDAFFETLATGDRQSEVSAALAAFDPTTYLAGFDFYTDSDRRFRYLRDDVLGPEKYQGVMDSMLARHRFDVVQAAERLWLDEGSVRQLRAEGHVIGLHSFSHPMQMGSLSRDRQEQEYRANYDYLATLLDEPVTSMSHPCNSYNRETLEILRGLGVQLGFRANMATSAAYGDYEHPREDHSNLLKLIQAPTP